MNNIAVRLRETAQEAAQLEYDTVRELAVRRLTREVMECQRLIQAAEQKLEEAKQRAEDRYYETRYDLE